MSTPIDPLLARVLADPDDAAARQVWADALLERGDPRGELVAIQNAARGGALTAAQDKRVRSLVARHRLAWLGPLADVVMHRAGLVWDRGVIDSCQIQIASLAALAAAIGHPYWATVRSVWFCDRYAWDPRIVPLLVHPVFRSLREVTCVGENAVFARLATHDRPLPFTSVWTVDDLWRTKDRALVRGDAASAPSLPHLKRLGFTPRTDDLSSILRLPVLQRIETLGLTTLDEPAGSLIPRVESLPALRTLELRPAWIPEQGMYRPTHVLRFTRGAGGRLSRLAIDAANSPAPAVLIGELASIPGDALEDIRVALPHEPWLRRALARFRRAAVTFVAR